MEKMATNNRIPFVDALKGFAILLVVMGHFLAGIYPDWKTALDSNAFGMSLWRVIYGFHMPLFMFCSGFVFYKPRDFFSFRNCSCTILKSFLRLILPYFSFGLLFYVFFDRFFVFWYLYVLFVFYIITLLIKCIVVKFKWWNIHTDSFFFLLLSFAAWIICGKLRSYEILPFLDLGHFSLYLYFILGHVVRQEKLQEILRKRNILFTIFVVLFFIVGLNKFNLISLPSKLSIFYPLSAIGMFFHFFSILRENGKFFKLLERFGRHSLEIYLLHNFFMIKLPMLGGGLDVLPKISSFVLQGIISFLASILIIAISFCVINLVSKSNILRKIFFGK